MKLNREWQQHGVQNEPHLRPTHLVANEVYCEMASGLAHLVATNPNVDETVDHSVWDEPSTVEYFSGVVPKNAVTFRNWFAFRSSQWTLGQSWLFTIAITVAAGPISLVAFLMLLPGMGWLTPVVECFFSPLIQELAKIAVPLWIVERRPFLFKNATQIAICTIGCGLVFGTVSGGLSLLVWRNQSMPMLIAVFTSYVALHLLCSVLATIGLYKIWKRPAYVLQPAQLNDGSNSFLSAFFIHAAFATIMLALVLIYSDPTS